jgi:hypothetical protein
MEDAIGSGRVRREGGFLWWGDPGQPSLRDRGGLPASSRKIELVTPEEIALAVHRVVADAYGMDRHEVPGAAVRLLGFGRVTGAMRTGVDSLIRQMLVDGELAQQGNQLVIPDQEDS